jgi:hypothetical protein
MFKLKALVIAGVAFILGVVGLSLVFSGVGSGESATGRIIVSAVFFLICGLGIGYFDPRAWIISGLSAWGSTLVGAFLVFAAIRKYGTNAFAAQEPPYVSVGLVLLLVPLSLALLGGYIGRRLNVERPKQTD